MSLYKHSYNGKYKDYIKDWGDDHYCEELEIEIDNWLQQFQPEDQQLMLKLLLNYNHFRAHQYDLKVKELFSIYKEYNPDWQYNTIFCSSCVEDDPAFSFVFFNDFWRLNDIKEFCRMTLKSEDVQDKNISHIVIVDDYSGSTSTILEFLAAVLGSYPQIADFHITILLMACSKASKLVIENFAINSRLKINVVSLYTFERAFSEGFIFENFENIENKERYIKICNELGVNFPLGMYKTEALLSFEYNTPNNTLGVFAACPEDNGDFKGLFPRKRQIHRPTPLKMREEMKQRCKNQLKASRENMKLGFIDFLFVGMCTKLKKKIRTDEITKRFGLTNEQFNIKIDYYCDCGLMNIEKGEFERTPKFTSLVSQREYKVFFDKYFADNDTDFSIEEREYLSKDFVYRFNNIR